METRLARCVFFELKSGEIRRKRGESFSFTCLFVLMLLKQSIHRINRKYLTSPFALGPSIPLFFPHRSQSSAPWTYSALFHEASRPPLSAVLFSVTVLKELPEAI